MSRDAGFSFLELMVALGIIAIIASLAVPGLINWRSTVRLREAAYYLKGDLEFAKSAAIKKNVSVGVQLSADTYTIFVDYDKDGGTAGDLIQNGPERLLRYRQLPAGVSIDLAATDFPDDDRTGFNSRGLPRTADGTPGPAEGTVTLKNSRDSRQVVLNRLGRLSTN